MIHKAEVVTSRVKNVAERNIGQRPKYHHSPAIASISRKAC